MERLAIGGMEGERALWAGSWTVLMGVFGATANKMMTVLEKSSEARF